MNIYDQLQAVEDRYEELGELLSDPDVVSDTKRLGLQYYRHVPDV